MIQRLGDFFWGTVPARVARFSTAMAVVLRDGAYIERVPLAAGLAPVIALLLGFIAGWRHPLATDVYMTSLLLLLVALVVGTLSAAVGFWLVLGYAIGDIVVGVRNPSFLGSFPNSGKTWAALILCDLVLGMLVVLIPLTARALANEASERWFRDRGTAAEIIIAVLVQALLVFAWTQAALVLTRPYFIWHGVAPNPGAIDTLHTAAWALPLVSIGAAALRAWLDLRLDVAVRRREPLPVTQRSKIPAPLGIALRVALAVFLLAGLMDSIVDPIIIAIVMIVFLVLREPALRRVSPRTNVVMRVPVLPRLIAGAVLSAVIAIVLVAAFGAGSVVRPVVISTLVSLIVFTFLLPDHVIGERVESADGAQPPAAGPAPPPMGAPASP